MLEGVECPECGHVYRDHSNIWGKTCYRCGTVISPKKMPKMVEENAKRAALWKEQVRESMRRRFKEQVNAALRENR
jgi:predicted  nucleic acid-binding Zn-ribbon protein